MISGHAWEVAVFPALGETKYGTILWDPHHLSHGVLVVLKIPKSSKSPKSQTTIQHCLFLDLNSRFVFLFRDIFLLV
jgi:hypothetical protein